VGIKARPMMVGDNEQPTHVMPEVMTAGGWRSVEVSSPRPRRWRSAWRNTKEDAMRESRLLGVGAGPAMPIVRSGARANPNDGARLVAASWCTTPDGAERWSTTDARGVVDDTSCPCPNIPIDSDRPPEPWEVNIRRTECGGGAGVLAERRDLGQLQSRKRVTFDPFDARGVTLDHELGAGRELSPEAECAARGEGWVHACWTDAGAARLCEPGEAPQCRNVHDDGSAGGFPWWILVVAAYVATRKK
jgi:hypothetical protein